MPRAASKGRASSKGRGRPKTAAASPKAAKAAAAAAAAPPPPMAFAEGDAVLAKWPGTALFFRAKVTFVRDDDQEYDVQYEDGTVFTIKAKDVSKMREVKPRTPARSRSRGRSPGRSRAKKAAAAAKEEGEKAAVKSPAAAAPATAAAPKPAKAKPAPATPTRQSARIAEKREFSADPAAAAAAKKAAAAPGLKDRLVGFVYGLSFEWITCLFFTAMSPFLLLCLHVLCTEKSCKPALPFDALPKTLNAYVDREALIASVAFLVPLRLFMLLPLGSKIPSASDPPQRRTGFITLLLCLAAVPVLVYKKVNLSLVSDKYFFLMTSAVLISLGTALIVWVKSFTHPEAKKNMNPAGCTGNPIVDICQGRELNPSVLGVDLKLTLFRISMISLALLNVVMVVNTIKVGNAVGEVNPVVVLASSFQVLYALDAMFFEEYFFFSHDYMNSGMGLDLICSYITFPYIPTLITQYLIQRSPVMKWYWIAGIAFVNAIGYIIFRASETQRCEFNKDPNSIKNLETITGSGGKKLLVSGWWGIVRHPNYLGELLIQWSWVLPAACTAGKVDLLVYYLPIMTTLVLILRLKNQNAKNKRKFGAAWTTYCERVRANLIPKVF